MPVRLAHRLGDYLQLPFVVVCNSRFQEVFRLFLNAFEELVDSTLVQDAKSAEDFAVLLRQLLRGHENTVHMLQAAGGRPAEGHAELHALLEAGLVELDAFLDQTCFTRIGNRVLAEHFLAVHEARRSTGAFGPAGELADFVGVVDPKCSPVAARRGSWDPCKVKPGALGSCQEGWDMVEARRGIDLREWEVVACVLILILSAYKILLIIQIFHTWSAEKREIASLKAFERDVEASLPEVQIEEPQDVCPVCLDDITPEQPARQLICKHCFHSACILGWFTQGGYERSKMRPRASIAHCAPPCFQELMLLNEQMKEIVRELSGSLAELCGDLYGERMEVNLEGELDTTLSFVPEHLRFILQEVLKNSFRATLDRHLPQQPPPAARLVESGSIRSVTVEVLKGTFDVTIKVSDRGEFRQPASDSRREAKGLTGVSRVLWADRQDDFQGLCGLDPASTRRLSGYGFGLPLSRVYARYFGGDIHVQSMHGYGTDVYLNVNHLGDALENDGTAKIRRVWVAS
ncbi:unnamed protein product [Effrenium voratum]|nr:unnamed protein product [Effrenium voratum]